MDATSGPPWPPTGYEVVATSVSEVADAVYGLVWRRELDRPGFALIRFAVPPEGAGLRKEMLALVDGLSRADRAAGGRGFVVERLGRFDQQVTSRFHRDGAPPGSIILLGYEPTIVPSLFAAADIPRAAHAGALSVDGFLASYNPMFPLGEARLRPFTTEFAVPNGESVVLVVNNSLYTTNHQPRPSGVFHKATIRAPDPAARRVINSIGITPDVPGAPALDPTAVERFRLRDDLD